MALNDNMISYMDQSVQASQVQPCPQLFGSMAKGKAKLSCWIWQL